MPAVGGDVDELRLADDAVQRLVVDDVVEEGAEPDALGLETVAGVGDRFGDGAAQVVVELVDELDERRLLVREVDIEGALGDAGTADDLGDRCPVVGELSEDVLGGGEDGSASRPSLVRRRLVQGPLPPWWRMPVVPAN